MKIDQALEWVISHNTALIEVLIGAILILSAVALYFAFTSEKEAAKEAGGSADLEITLRKVLNSIETRPALEVERAASKIKDEESGMAVTGAAPEGASPAEMEALKGAISDRDKAIADLKTALEDAKKAQASAAAAAAAAPPPADGAAAAGGVDIKALETKVQDLQARLAEYEIIEDDIANLSLYRNENAKLKEELDNLRALVEAAGGKVPAAAPAADAAPAEAAPPVAAVPDEPPPPDDIVGEFQAALQDKPVDVQGGKAATTSTPKELNADPMAAFEAALGSEPIAAPVPPPPVAAAPPPPPPPPPAAAPAAPALAAESSGGPDIVIDASKLVEEALGLENAPQTDGDGSDPLSNPLNTDKLLEEALGIQNASGDGKG